MLWQMEGIFSNSQCKIILKHDNIRKIATDQGDNYTIGCLLDYPYYKNYYKIIAIDLSKQQKLDSDWKGVQQINFAGNLTRVGGCNNVFHYWAIKSLSKGAVKVLYFFSVLIKY